MNNRFSTKDFLKSVKQTPFLMACLPLEYSYGLPTLCVLNDTLCMKVPFLRYKITGVVDKTLVYPIKYVATFILPERIAAGFEDLTINPAYAKVDFNTPAGTFRHKAIRDLDKRHYNELRDKLYAHYDKIINALVYGDDYDVANDETFKQLLQRLIEPSLLPFYSLIDGDFYNKYLSK